MMAWSRKHTMVAGVALIAATNAVALVGVAYNRSGEPGSVLQLTQRELGFPYRDNNEDSGIVLSLHWRSIPAKTSGDEVEGYLWGTEDYGTPLWLDHTKLSALGFDLAAVKRETRKREGYAEARAKEVLLVLELDGPAYQQALKRAGEITKRATELSAANPGSRDLMERANSVKRRLAQENAERSRLFVVDAGLDAGALRAAYPDRNVYAIVRGRLRPYVYLEASREVVRTSIELNVKDINVPHAFRHVFVRNQAIQPPGSLKYTVGVAFGKRFEPWVTQAASSD
jgi:hypothetical protein